MLINIEGITFAPTIVGEQQVATLHLRNMDKMLMECNFTTIIMRDEWNNGQFTNVDDSPSFSIQPDFCTITPFESIEVS